MHGRPTVGAVVVDELVLKLGELDVQRRGRRRTAHCLVQLTRISAVARGTGWASPHYAEQFRRNLLDAVAESSVTATTESSGTQLW
jgi:hypothetical protein